MEAVLGSGLTGAWYLTKTFGHPEAAAASGTILALSAGGVHGDAEADEQETGRDRADVRSVIGVKSLR